MINRTEAKAIYAKSVVEIKQRELDEELKLIRDTMEWCDTVLSDLIKDKAESGYNRLLLTAACTFKKCVIVCKVGKSKRVPIHFNTLVQIVENCGFTITPKTVESSIHWQNITIGW